MVDREKKWLASVSSGDGVCHLVELGTNKWGIPIGPSRCGVTLDWYPTSTELDPKLTTCPVCFERENNG